MKRAQARAKRTKPSDLERLVEWVKKRKIELEINCKASEGQSAADVIRGQWLAYDEMLEKHLQPKLDKARRAATHVEKVASGSTTVFQCDERGATVYVDGVAVKSQSDTTITKRRRAAK